MLGQWSIALMLRSPSLYRKRTRLLRVSCPNDFPSRFAVDPIATPHPTVPPRSLVLKGDS